MMNSKSIQIACAFLHQDAKLFIAKRAATKKFLPGKWELPGGHVEPGETPQQALQREMSEEFGVKVEVGEHVYRFSFTKDGRETTEDIFFATLAPDSPPVQLDPNEHSEFAWITADEIDQYLIPDDEETKAARKGFTLLPG